MATEDPIMAKVRAKFQASKLTMHELGLAMGYPPDSARKSVSQFLKGDDPRVSTLRRFAVAMKMSLGRLVS